MIKKLMIEEPIVADKWKSPRSYKFEMKRRNRATTVVQKRITQSNDIVLIQFIHRKYHGVHHNNSK